MGGGLLRRSMGADCLGHSVNAAISFSDLTLGYDRHPAVHHLNGDVQLGSLTAVVGPNGAGKSTLLKAIIGNLRPLCGAVSINSHAAPQIAYLPQQSEIDRSFPVSVFDIVAMGLWRKKGCFGGFTAADEVEVAKALSAVGLEGFERRTLDTLSGGQVQRTLFGRLLLQDAPLILLDEPFNSIDAKTSADLMQLIQHWHGERRTILAVLHDLAQVRANFPETLLLARSPIAWGKTETVLTSANLLKARAMSEAWHEGAAFCGRGDNDHL
jgi:zinc/manganese transport system ATP-binding protein